jgi:hypothetical protein
MHVLVNGVGLFCAKLVPRVPFCGNGRHLPSSPGRRDECNRFGRHQSKTGAKGAGFS